MKSKHWQTHVIAGIVLLLMVVFFAPATSARVAEEWSRPLEVGQMAPDFALPDSGGRMVQLSRFAEEKYVILDFYLGWF